MNSDEKVPVTRTGISFDPNLLKKFDKWIEEKGIPNRSEAVRYIIREYLAKQETAKNPQIEVVGALTYIFNHHNFNSTAQLTKLQHIHEELIISTMHAHVSHELCLETIILRGKYQEVQKFKEEVLSFKGVLSGDIVISTIG